MESTLPPPTIGDALAARAREQPGAPALAFPLSGGKLTYGEWWDRSRAVAAALVRRGVVPGDHVALLAENRLEWPLVQMAVALAGAVLVPLGPPSNSARSYPKVFFAGLSVKTKACSHARANFGSRRTKSLSVPLKSTSMAHQHSRRTGLSLETRSSSERSLPPWLLINRTLGSVASRDDPLSRASWPLALWFWKVL